MKLTLNRELAGWFDRSILDITPANVKDLIRTIKARGEAQARFVNSLLKALFVWTVKTGDFGLEVSPYAKIDTKTLVGETVERDRTLEDHELAAYWRAAEKLSYPHNQCFRLVALAALRRDEAADISRKEIDMGAKRLVIPAERMKGQNGKARPHLVPITPKIEALLGELPPHDGPFLFSSSMGAKPISDHGRAKAKLDALMRADLEANGHAFVPFLLHDVRRTVRTKLDEFKIGTTEIRELLIAHARPKIQRIYSVFEFEDEKREALEAWHRALDGIVNPKPRANVIPMHAA